jgi:tetratricopeptide (TPR) repeat protein
MRSILTFAGSCTLVVVAVTAGSAQQSRTSETAATQLTKVKALYASASYEDALANLEMIAPAEASEQVEQYRALCFLALNRIPEAERALEMIVRRAPFHRMSDAEVSPRLVAMFAEVRRRVLPAAAKETYARARWNYQGGQYDEAAADLRQLLAMLADPDLADASRDVMDLKLVAEGFLKLAEAEIARQPARPATPRSAAPDGQPPANDAPVPAPLKPRPPVENGSGPSRIYNDDDSSVKAPIELSRQMPVWTPPAGFTGQEFRGVLELVIDESGRVTSAVSLGAVMPNYDDALRAAARQWKYRPAMLRDGTPVRYRLLVGYLLKPTDHP